MLYLKARWDSLTEGEKFDLGMLGMMAVAMFGVATIVLVQRWMPTLEQLVQRYTH